MKVLAIVMALALTACGFKAEVDPAEAHKTMYCTDTRDGEKFSFAVSSVRDASLVIGSGACATVTTHAGKEMRLCNEMQSYLKCEAR